MHITFSIVIEENGQEGVLVEVQKHE